MMNWELDQLAERKRTWRFWFKPWGVGKAFDHGVIWARDRISRHMRDNTEWETGKRIKLEEENSRLKQALGYYADMENYREKIQNRFVMNVVSDQGRRARTALYSKTPFLLKLVDDEKEI